MNLAARVIEIFKELRRLQATKFSFEDGFPGLIDTGNGSLITSPRIENEIGAIAKVLMDNDGPAARQFTQAEWLSLVRKSFGPVLGNADIDDESLENTKIILQELRKSVELTRQGYGPKAYAVGCTLFSNTDIEPIAIGPVTIEARDVWLSGVVSAGLVSSITARRIRRLWSGEVKRLRKRKKFIDQTREKDILESVGRGPFVCRIETTGLASETGKSKALMAGRLALATVSLLWERPSTALDGFRLRVDGDVRKLKVLTLVSGVTTLAGSKISHLPSGHTFQPGEWAAQKERSQKLFVPAGEVLQYYLHPTGDIQRAPLLNVLMQSLLWFHESCRETVDAMAIVKYVSAMDALACGTESRGITEVLRARCGLRPDKPLFKGKTETTKQVVERIYREGRSRTVHGTNEKLTHDWIEMRNRAETLARMALVGALIWAGDSVHNVDPQMLRAR